MSISHMSRRVRVAAGATLLISGALASQLALGPLATADRTITPQDACNSYKPGYVPVVAAFTMGELICIAPGTIPVAGLNDSMAGRVRAGNLPALPANAYRVNPFDPFSPWVIPG